MPAELDCTACGLYLSTPGGILTWMGMYPFPPFARLLMGRESVALGLVLPLPPPKVCDVGDARLANLAIRLGALAFFLGNCRVTGMSNGMGFDSGAGERSSGSRLGSLLDSHPRPGLARGNSPTPSSSLKSSEYGSFTRRVLRLGAMSPSSNMPLVGCVGLLSFLIRALDEFIELSVRLVDVPLYRMSGSVASTAPAADGARELIRVHRRAEGSDRPWDAGIARARGPAADEVNEIRVVVIVVGGGLAGLIPLAIGCRQHTA